MSVIHQLVCQLPQSCPTSVNFLKIPYVLTYLLTVGEVSLPKWEGRDVCIVTRPAKVRGIIVCVGDCIWRLSGVEAAVCRGSVLLHWAQRYNVNNSSSRSIRQHAAVTTHALMVTSPTHTGTHRRADTHTSTAWCVRGRTAETFTTLSDLILVWVCVSGGGLQTDIH